MPRKDLSLAERISLLDRLKTYGPGTTQRELSTHTGVPKTTIARLLKQESVLRSQWAESSGNGSSRKRRRDGKDPLVDQALTQWFDRVSEHGVPVNGPVLMGKAEELAAKLGRSEFKSTNGWFERWKNRHQIRYKKSHGEKRSADVASADAWKSDELPRLLEEFSPNDLYNADETGLFYRATPNGSLCYAFENLSGSKRPMERLSVLLCANMSGSDKRKLLVIGKSRKPRCFKGIRVDLLPVTYRANENAWMTALLFKEWLKTWNKDLIEQGRKICLLVDNCSAHPEVELSNIRLEFLPANTTSLIQPMDMGIIKNLKTFYRQELVSRIIASIENNIISSEASAADISKTINVLQAIHMTADSWRAVSAETIQNCFKHCFGTGESILRTTSSDVVPDIPAVTNYEDYLNIDESIQCCAADESYEDDIVATLTERAGAQEDSSDEEDDASHIVSVQEASLYIERLRRFFLQEDIGSCPEASLNECADRIRQISMKRRKQTTLHTFFNAAS